MDAIGILLRLAHVLAAATLAGATLFRVLGLRRALRAVEPPAQAALGDALRRRWLPFEHTALLLLLGAGAANLARGFASYEAAGLLPLVLTKVGLGLVLVVLVVLLGAGKLARHRGRWQAFGVGLVIVVFALSAIVRASRLALP